MAYGFDRSRYGMRTNARSQEKVLGPLIKTVDDPLH
jgi:hypothetical protein